MYKISFLAKESKEIIERLTCIEMILSWFSSLFFLLIKTSAHVVLRIGFTPHRHRSLGDELCLLDLDLALTSHWQEQLHSYFYNFKLHLNPASQTPNQIVTTFPHKT
jgi:hypothetical protein